MDETHGRLHPCRDHTEAGVTVAVQLLAQAETITKADMVVTLARWHPLSGTLDGTQDLVLPKASTVRSLCDRITSAPAYMSARRRES